MKSEQKPKEIKIEFTCEVKEKPLSPKLQKRKKRADAAETFFSLIVVILLILIPYLVVSTNDDWTDAQYTLFFTLLGALCFSICAVRLCHFIYKNPTLKKERGNDFFPSDYFF